jgi:hypothetical protein
LLHFGVLASTFFIVSESALCASSMELDVAASMPSLEAVSVKKELEAAVKEESPRLMLAGAEQSHTILSADVKQAPSDAPVTATAPPVSAIAADDSDDSDEDDGDNTPNAKRAGRVMPAAGSDEAAVKKKNARVSCHQVCEAQELQQHEQESVWSGLAHTF